jgi:hypothetical protein
MPRRDAAVIFMTVVTLLWSSLPILTPRHDTAVVFITRPDAVS